MDNSISNFHQVFDNTEAISVQGYDMERRVIYWNKASEILYGYSEKEAFGRNIEDLIIPSAMRSQVIESVKSLLENGIPIPSKAMTLCRADGSQVEVFSSRSMIDKNGTKEMYCIDIDLSEFIRVKKQAKQGEKVLNSVFQSLPDIFFLMDKDCRILEYRSSNSNNLYVSPKTFLGKHMQDVVPSSVGQLFIDNCALVSRTGEIATFEYSMDVAEGYRHFEARLSRLSNSTELIVIIRDITEQKDAIKLQQNNEHKYRQMFERHRAIKLIVDPEDGSIVEGNSAALEFYGYSDQELKSLKVMDINTLSGNRIRQEMELAEQEHRLFFSFRHRLKSGEIRDVEVYSGPLEYGEKNYLYSIIHDVSARKVAEKKIIHQAYYDSLTGLPNRFLALDRLSKLLSESKRLNKKVAVTFLDLDDFKKINDTLGHESGDNLLIEASQRLKNIIRSDDTVGRLGGDEFILLLRGLDKGTDAIYVIDNLLKQFRKPFLVDGHELALTASIGVAVYPDDGEDPSVLLRHADTAMYKAKETGRNTYSFYTESMNKAMSTRLHLESYLHGALERDEFSVHFQPQIDLETGKIIGAEALIRWSNGTIGNVTPDNFIPIAEQTGLIVPIGEYVIMEVLKTLTKLSKLSKLLKKTDGQFRMAVNLSPLQFRDPALVSFITDSVNEAGFESNRLELEITEGLLLTGYSNVEEVLNELSQAGFSISMDDFGTGYSSLSYLRQYPFNVLKIDRSFVAGITENRADRELVIATIAMAHGLGLKVVAEGVESSSQQQLLSELNCDYAQGYLFARPMSEKNLFEYIDSYSG